MERNELQIIYGNEPGQMIEKILDAVNITEEITPEMLIGLKPNLVLASPSENGATTSPKLVGAVIEYLQKHGFNKIVILEGSWVGAKTDRAFKICGYKDLSQKYNIPLIDLKKDSFQEIKVSDLKIKVCQQALKIDYLINLPVLKAHCQTKLTCALKNLKGCIPDQEKRRFHSLGLHKPIAYLNKALITHLTIVDAINGDLTFEEGGNPVQMDRIIVGKDPVLIDSYGASLLGYPNNEIGYIGLAESIGIGSAELKNAQIVEHNAALKKNHKFQHSRQVERLARKIEAKDACSACYGGLIHALKRLEEKGDSNKIKKVFIGQGFKGKTAEGIGIGNCTRGFTKSLGGCPPSARKIVEYIENL